MLNSESKSEDLKSSENKKLPFKLETDIFFYGISVPVIKTGYYNSLKLLRQASARKNAQYMVMSERKYMLNDKGEYEPFAVFGKSAIGLSQLKTAVARLELEEIEKQDPYMATRSGAIPKTWK